MLYRFLGGEYMRIFRVLFILFILVRVSYGDELDGTIEFRNKAMMAYQQHDDTNSLKYLKKSLIIYEKVLGKEHKTGLFTLML